NKQHKQLTYLNNMLLQASCNTAPQASQWLKLIQWIARHHVSIKQQHMLANALRLDRIAIDR
ncbi:MAG: hypothetical protein WBG74_10795, partial [Shewanella sp.]